jgi:hypothetical protein
MQTWEIRKDGQPISQFVSMLRAKKHEATIIAQWKARSQYSGYDVEDAGYTANPYITTALDRYGK